MATRTRKKVTATRKTAVEDPIEGFKDVQIKKLAYRAGTQRIERDTYDTVRLLIATRIGELLRKILVFTNQKGRKTVNLNDLCGALESEGISLMAGGNTARDIKKSKAKAKAKPKTPEEGSSSDQPKKTRRLKPGTAAQKEIKRHQETSDRLIFKQNRFEAYVRDQTKKHSDVNLRFSKDFFKIFQVVLEQYLVTILVKATRAVDHAGRKSLTKKDIDFVTAVF